MKRKNALRLFLFMIVLICLPVQADLVRLKDGTSYRGEIIEENDDSIRIKLDAGGSPTVKVNREEIRRILRDTPEESARKKEEQKRAQGLVKDGDEWVTREVKAAREAQRKAEQARKVQGRAKFQREIDKLKQEQKQLQETEQSYPASLERSRERMTGDLRNIVLKLAFFVVLGIVAVVLLKRYFWD